MDGSVQLRFIMSNGEKSNLPWNGKNGKIVKVEPADSVISKILVCFNNTSVTRGIKLFTKDGKCVLQAGCFDYDTTEIILQEGERILGIKSYASAHLGDSQYAQSLDWVFVLGRLE